jgi:sec-independent protein translocase protein TatA
MFDIGLQEMLVIGVIALLVFGPSKLPELGRMVGRALREFRRASDEFRQTVETNLNLNDPDPIGHPSSVPTSETAPPTATLMPSGAEPVADGTEASAVATTTEPAEPFCGKRSSRLFHRTDCAWVLRIPEAERAYFKHVADAREQGYVTCPVCEPWEPA